MDEHEPQTEETRSVREQVLPEDWAERVREAENRVLLLRSVADRHEETGESWRRCLAAVSPDTGWSKYLHWRRCSDCRQGPAWERLLDRSVPPPPAPAIPEAVVRAACMLRRLDRSINCDDARTLLREEFGAELEVSDAWLRRRWAEAGLGHVPNEKHGPVGEEVERFHGGGALALLTAADAETGASLALARAVLTAGAVRAEQQGEVTPREEHADERDERGRFTAAYNGHWREGHGTGERDERWASDKAKRMTRSLADLPVLGHRQETLAHKLLCMGASALLTERRGFDGLDGPSGAWLGVFGGVAYMPATLDKALAQLGYLGTDAALWATHGGLWAFYSKLWSDPEPGWVQTAAYIDATSDPYWTRQFARSGKVSRVGRVMPCLTRVALTSGAGVPLLVETHPGAVSLKKRLGPMLAHLDEVLGPGGEVGRLTIVDSEAGTAGAMWALHEQADRLFITVLKGNVRKGARVYAEGAWLPYRNRDEVREVVVDLAGRGAPKGGITVRGVEMRRESRRPVTTLFATNAAADELGAEQVATAYLARWPHGEQLFRDSRNGIGLDRSHGYGGGEVTHVALETKLEQVSRRVERAKTSLDEAKATRTELAEATTGIDAAARKKTLALADKEVRRATSTLAQQEATRARLDTLPRTIYERDTGRDSIMTCLKLTLSMLIEFVLREYFGGYGLEWRTFIEQFVALPVTVRTTNNRRLYQIEPNPRQPENMIYLAKALREVNARRIHRDDRLLVFELVGFDEPGS
ncbi:MAG: hypothetical protein GY856_38885 [bacterium]|nr:hypothetical protein [bacterium]